MTRVLIVDDDALVRSALQLMLGGHPDLDVVGEAADGHEAIVRCAELAPDVVLMDIRMPAMNGLEATRRLLDQAEAPHVIMLTTFDADEHVLEALAAGADGFLLKDTSPPDIVSAIRRVAAGDAILSPSATRVLIGKLRGAAGPDDRQRLARERLQALTAREQEVAQALGEGLSNAEVGARLFLSVPTVKAHVSRVFDKLGVVNRVQVAICVHDAGLDDHATTES